MKANVILVDQTEALASFGGQSLFVNGVHIIDSNDQSSFDIEDVAQSFALSLGVVLQKTNLTASMLAVSIATKNDELNKFYESFADAEDTGSFYNDWCDGYTNDDVRFALTPR